MRCHRTWPWPYCERNQPVIPTAVCIRASGRHAGAIRHRDTSRSRPDARIPWKSTPLPSSARLQARSSKAARRLTACLSACCKQQSADVRHPARVPGTYSLCVRVFIYLFPFFRCRRQDDAYDDRGRRSQSLTKKNPTAHPRCSSGRVQRHDKGHRIVLELCLFVIPCCCSCCCWLATSTNQHCSRRAAHICARSCSGGAACCCMFIRKRNRCISCRPWRVLGPGGRHQGI